MNLEELQDILNRRLLTLDNRGLNDVEQLLLKGLWQNQTYLEVAQQKGYSSSYLANVVAPELYRRLSKLTGGHITKKNCLEIIQLYLIELISPSPLENGFPSYPNGTIPLNSPFYLRHTALEAKIIEEITQSGALVRIKAPQEKGKTSLLLRILETCQQKLGYKTVSLDLQKVDQNILGDLNQFLRWLCINCARQLKVDAKLDDYWDEDIGIKMSWTIYFEDYLLQQIDCPFVLALDEVNLVFEHPQVAEDFFPLLRSCYEESKRSPLWQKFRLIIVQTTEVYVDLQLDQSPFNVGLPIELQDFSQEQVKQLAEKYQLNCKEEDIKQLMRLVGGHPALIHLAIYHIKQEKITIQEVLKSAITSDGIYRHHLQRHWVKLQKNPELVSAFKRIYQGSEPVYIDPIIAYKLNSMGLINLMGNKATVSCQLYQQYFASQSIID